MAWPILLVEDDLDIREALGEILEARGYRLISAANGAEAIANVEQRAIRPAVIVLDLMMPVMDGEQFLAEQDNHALLRGVPVLVLTARSNPPEPMPSTVRATFSKPLPLPPLLDAIRRVCAGGRA